MPVVRFKGNTLDPATINALVAATLVNGTTPSAWWKRQSVDFRNSFMDTIRTSMNNGESLQQAITRVVGGTIDGVAVPGVMQTTKRKAGALVSTSMSAVTNEAAIKSYQANNDVVKAITQLSTLDNKTSDICIAYSGQTWDVNTLQPIPELGGSLPFNGGPPRHFNCRSRLRPVTKSFRELGLDKDEIPPGTRASMDGQVPADITFSDWLKTKPDSFADDLLGPGRARLWRNGDINLTQLVDMRGNPMSLTQLEARVGIKPQPKPTIRPQPRTKPPSQKMVDSFLENDDGTFVQITQAEYDEIRNHAKRLVSAADEADDAVTAAVKEIADDIGAKFPDAPIVEDGPMVKDGSLHYRKKDLDSTSRKIQTYARDRGISYTEAADQISDSLRYTYMLAENEYAAGVIEAMEKFAEMGYRNGKFDVAWVKRPDYKGINVNLVTPNGVRMELQFHTATSFDVKQNINHKLYEKFRKLSKGKQKGPEGQAIQAEMLANAQAIPVPQYMDELVDLAKIYDRPNPAKQAKILKEAAERKATREARKLASRSPKPDDQLTYVNKPDLSQLSARKFLNNNGYDRKFIAMNMNETHIAKLKDWNPDIARRLLKDAEKVKRDVEAAKIAAQTVTDPKLIRKEAHKFLLEEGIEERFLHLVDDFLELIEGASSVSFGPDQKKVLLDLIKPRVAQELVKEKKLAELAAKGAEIVAPDMKDMAWKDIKDWYAKNLTNPESNFADVVGKSAFTGDKQAYQLTANVTLMMRDRFGLTLPNYSGMRAGHPYNFGRSSANAAVHMDSDSLLLIAKGMTHQDRLEQAWNQWIRYHGNNQPMLKVGNATWNWTTQGERMVIRTQLRNMKTDNPALKRAILETLDNDDYSHSVWGMERDANIAFWRTAVHENGHRVHAAYRKEVDAILKRIQDEGEWGKWVKVVSKYSGKNGKEFVAESFLMYMTGRPERVHPFLREFFERIDKGGSFGKALFKQHNRP